MMSDADPFKSECEELMRGCQDKDLTCGCCKVARRKSEPDARETTNNNSIRDWARAFAMEFSFEATDKHDNINRRRNIFGFR